MSSALPLALAAGVYPLGLAIVLRYLGDPPSMPHAYAYLVGSATMTLAAGIGILLAFRGFGLTERQHPAPSGGVQVGLGVALLAVAVWLFRGRKPADGRGAGPARPERTGGSEKAEVPGMARTAEVPEKADAPSGLGSVFALGLVTYLPSLLYVSAIKNLADDDLSITVAVLVLLVCAVLVLQMVELPIILRLVAPRRAGTVITAYNAWMHRHGRDVVILLTVGGGVYMIANGIATLVG